MQCNWSKTQKNVLKTWFARVDEKNIWLSANVPQPFLLVKIIALIVVTLSH